MMANQLQVGDFVPVMLGNKPRSACIEAAVPHLLPAKNVLVTEAGMVVANNFLTTTICDGTKGMEGLQASNLSIAVDQWRRIHSFLLA